MEIQPAFATALDGLEVGAEVVLLTWLHQSNREVLRVRPRSEPNRAERGVFSTRSPDRPNPIGLHPVTILEVTTSGLRVEPLEAIDGTPVLDIKPVLKG
ncbi:MAG: tRNA (N6-threonylcarbamoyladenosine(37)-N6)-methyltransferase TrmO [Vulcanimicrobiota bacterium]